jgi:hypothetical protein
VPLDAGFAAVVSVNETVLTSVLRLIRSQKTSLFLNVGAFPIQPMSWNIYLDEPEIKCHAGDAGTVRIAFRAWGEVTDRTLSGPEAIYEVVWNLVVNAEPLVTIKRPPPKPETPEAPEAPEAQPVFHVSIGACKLRESTHRILRGGVIRPDFEALVAGLPNDFAGQLSNSSELSGDFAASMLGGIASDPTATTSVVVGDGAVLVGIDLNSESPDPGQILEGLVTRGDRSALAPIGGGVGAVISAVAIPLAFSEFETAFRAELAKNEATLLDFKIRADEGALHVTGKVDVSGGSAAFSFDVVPRLLRESVFFGAENVEVDTDFDWWVDVLNVLSFGLAGLIASSLTAWSTWRLQDGIGRGSTAASIRRRTLAIIPGAPGIDMSVRGLQLDSTEGFVLQLAFDLAVAGAALEGPGTVNVFGSCDFSVRLPFALTVGTPPPVDPRLRIRWSVRRFDTNEVAFARDGEAASLLKLRLSQDEIPLATCDRFVVSVRMYRPFGTKAVTEILNASSDLRVTDIVDRTHPFVRWKHVARIDQVRVEPNGRKVLVGRPLRERQSKIHRTHLTERCSMLISITQPLSPPHGERFPPKEVEYLDVLPFPAEELAEHRRQVCDYCFFGGPDKSVSLL